MEKIGAGKNDQLQNNDNFPRDLLDARDVICDNLDKIQALAGILGSLAYLMAEDRDPDMEIFRTHGERYCDTIESMAREVAKHFDQSFRDMYGPKDGMMIPLNTLEMRLAFLKNSARPEDLQHIEDILKEIDDLMAKGFIPLARMKQEFDAVRDRILKARPVAAR